MQLQIAAKPPVQCCHLANTNNKLAIPLLVKLLWSLLLLLPPLRRLCFWGCPFESKISQKVMNRLWWNLFSRSWAWLMKVVVRFSWRVGLFCRFWIDRDSLSLRDRAQNKLTLRCVRQVKVWDLWSLLVIIMIIVIVVVIMLVRC